MSNEKASFERHRDRWMARLVKSEMKVEAATSGIDKIINAIEDDDIDGRDIYQMLLALDLEVSKL